MRNPLFFISFLLFPSVLSAQIPDLNVTAFHVLGNTSGSLSIVISPNYPPPFSLIITGPNGYTSNTTMTTNSYNLSGLSIGEYCVSVSNGAGCIATLCIKIKKCNIYTFRGIEYTSCLDEAPTGDPDILYAKGRFVSVNNLQVELIPQSSTVLSDSQKDGIMEIIDETMSHIRQHGSSPYEVSSQNEVEAEGYDYVFKLNTDANLIWVYHVNSSEERSYRYVANTTAPFLVYPNPTSDAFRIFFSGKHYNGYKVSLTDLTGRIIVSDLVPTEPNMNISTASLSSGIYLLNVCSENKQNTVKVIVLR